MFADAIAPAGKRVTRVTFAGDLFRSHCEREYAISERY